jgi:DnaK suppressor protein
MTSTDVTIIVIDPADIKPSDAKALVVREGDEAWKVTDLRAIVRLLNEDVERLAREVESTEAELDDLLHTAEGSGDDQADAGSTALEREQEMSIVHNTHEMLEQSVEALNRIKLHHFGVCVACGAGIGKARLMAFPRATQCVTCKQREERR